VKPTIVGLLVFLSTIWAPVDKLLSFLVTLNTRKNEFQADEYSVNLNYGKNDVRSDQIRQAGSDISNKPPPHFDTGGGLSKVVKVAHVSFFPVFLTTR
jgi:STE24 endopeptidase